MHPSILIVTQDGLLLDILARAVGADGVETRFDARSARDLLSEPSLHLVVVDDGAVAESERGWFLDQIHHRAPDAFVIYVATVHSPEIECRARAHGVLYYTSRPIDADRLSRVLQSLPMGSRRGENQRSGTAR